MKRLLLATAAVALATAPALAQTLSTSPSGTAPTAPCMSSGAPPSTNVDRSGTGSGGNKPGTTESSEAANASLSHSDTTTTGPNTASDATGCQ